MTKNAGLCEGCSRGVRLEPSVGLLERNRPSAVTTVEHSHP
jgi:hypothetical protein